MNFEIQTQQQQHAEPETQSSASKAPKSPRKPRSRAVEVQQVTCAHGGWKWARQRGYYRVVVVDPELPHSKVYSPGYIEEIGRTGDITFDYPGGRYGYEEALDNAIKTAKKTARNRRIPYLG